jgi:hypothetical protein
MLGTPQGRLGALAGLVVLITLVLCASAVAATPRGFFGVTYDREIRDSPSATQDAQFRAMAANRVQSARIVFDWSHAQPQEAGPIDFTRIDAAVARAARNHIIVLATVLYAPAWAQINPFAGA